MVSALVVVLSILVEHGLPSNKTPPKTDRDFSNLQIDF
jgi:hypothetical protein